jgi:hypothetical protein
MTWVRDRRMNWAAEQRQLRWSVLLASGALTLLVIIGTVVMHQIEAWSWISSFYFSVTTLATVGYGDLHPSHDASRLFVAFYVIAGVTIALNAMAIVGRNYLAFMEQRLVNAEGHDVHHREHRTGRSG